MKITINLGIKVSTDENKMIGVENITNCVRKMELNRDVTKRIIEEYQNKQIDELCGLEYKRNRDTLYVRSGKKKRTTLCVRKDGNDYLSIISITIKSVRRNTTALVQSIERASTFVYNRAEHGL